MLYICIPAYDEADTIGVLLWRTRQVMAEFGRDYELLVLDDGSGDETAEVLASYREVLPLHLIRHEKQRGYAASLERLIRESVSRSTHPRRDIVLTLQGDFTESPEDIPVLVKRIEGGADLVGARSVRDADATRALRWSRRGLGWMLRGLPNSDPVSDPLSGFRAYRVSALRAAVEAAREESLLPEDGWAANLGLLLAVTPHARRREAADLSMRYDLRRRPSRFDPWATARGVWRVRRGRGTRRPNVATGASSA